MKHLTFLLALALLLTGCGTQKNLTRLPDEQPVKTDGHFDIEPGTGSYSIQHVDFSEKEKVSYRSFEDYVIANVSGVEMSASGGLIIRGVGTFNGSSAPLILMDGMEVHDTSVINPNDIHAIDVIKDGGTAAYGMRGANGVILITSEAAYLAKKAEQEAKKREKEAAKAARKAAKDSKKK